MSTPSITVISRREGETWAEFLMRLLPLRGDILLVMPPEEKEAVEQTDMEKLLHACEERKSRLRIATRNPLIIGECRKRGITILSRVRKVREYLAGHANVAEALRVFSPHLWQQELRSRLQRVGLLSLPKLRIWILIGTSVLLFLFVIFRLLPSAEVRVKPRQDSISQTANVYLTQTGSIDADSSNVRRIGLQPITVEVQRSLTYDDMFREFTGRSAQVQMVIRNQTNEKVYLLKGSRLRSESGGLLFYTRNDVIVPAHGTGTVSARAADKDLYDEIIGERGNVQAGLRWFFPGLEDPERTKITAVNPKPGRGGTTSSRLVFRREDLGLARQALESALVATAKQEAEDRLFELNERSGQDRWRIFTDDQLTKAVFHDIVLPEQFIGETLDSVPVEGAVTYTVLAYDAEEILELLRHDLESHVEQGKMLLLSSIALPGLKTYVIKYDDGLAWVKLTVELTAAQQFILDPLTPEGAEFARRVREGIQGKPKQEALKIIRNMPEVDHADLRLWPPWSKKVTEIPGNISIEQQ